MLLIKFLIVGTVIFCLFSESWAAVDICDYQQVLEPNITYYVYNNGFPNKYPRYSTCTWTAETLENHVIELSCNISIPKSENCVNEKLSVSLSGDPKMRDEKIFCGDGHFKSYSWDNKMDIVFKSRNSQGGTFLCTILAIEQKCNCGWQKTVRIVGGIEASPNEFPMMAGLVDTDQRIIFCGATIIAKRYLVTAAHCCYHRDPSNTAVVVGMHDVRTGKESPVSQFLEIQYLQKHEQFKTSPPKNDICLVKVTKDILYSGQVGPACLPLKYLQADLTGLAVTVMGWGTQEFSGSPSDVLMKTNLVIQSNATCHRYYRDSVTDDQICTYGNRTDSCQMDSGGPSLWLDPTSERWNFIGITSYGNGCATKTPSVSTRVSRYVQWIARNTPGVGYCYK